MSFLISSTQFQTLAIAWIGTGLIVVTALLAALLKVLPEIKALWAVANQHDEQINNLNSVSPSPVSGLKNPSLSSGTTNLPPDYSG